MCNLRLNLIYLSFLFSIIYIPQLPINQEIDLHTVLNIVLRFGMNRGNAVMMTPFRSRNKAPQNEVL